MTSRYLLMDASTRHAVPSSEYEMTQDQRERRLLYGRIITSVVLYALFIILSTSAVLTRSLQDQPLVLGGLLIGSALILPRHTRRMAKSDEPAPTDEAQRRARIQRWLTWVRLAYLLMAAFVWFGLPALVG